MPLIYSFVARGTTVLADYTAYTGNFSVIAIQVCLLKRAFSEGVMSRVPNRAETVDLIPSSIFSFFCGVLGCTYSHNF